MVDRLRESVELNSKGYEFNSVFSSKELSSPQLNIENLESGVSAWQLNLECIDHAIFRRKFP